MPKGNSSGGLGGRRKMVAKKKSVAKKRGAPSYKAKRKATGRGMY